MNSQAIKESAKHANEKNKRKMVIIIVCVKKKWNNAETTKQEGWGGRATYNQYCLLLFLFSSFYRQHTDET
jgi:hypothetical protein